MSKVSAIADVADVLSYSPHALQFGYELLHGRDDNDEGSHSDFYGTRTSTGAYRAALPDLSGRSASCNDIFEQDEAEHDAAEYEDAIDRILARARRDRPDNGEGVIETFRAEVPAEFRNARPRGNVGRLPAVIRAPLTQRSVDRRVNMAKMPSASATTRGTEQQERARLQNRLERAGVKPARAANIATTAKLGTLGAKLLASIAKSGSANALDVVPDPLPHRARRLREGVVRRSADRA